MVSVHFDLAHGAFSGTGYKEIDVEGQRFRVLMGTDAVEVEEWRNERRRRFPTAAAIERRGEAKRRLGEAGGICAQGNDKKAKRRRDPPVSASTDSTAELVVGEAGGGV